MTLRLVILMVALPDGEVLIESLATLHCSITGIYLIHCRTVIEKDEGI